MAKDPALLWYFSDWNSGTALMSRFLKGCYMDLLHAQFNHGRLSLEEIKICLGSDFGTSWPALQKKFKQDENGLFFNERLEQEKIKRQNFVASRNKNLEQKKEKPIHMETHMQNHMNNHMENRNENGDANEDWLKWGEQILNCNDQHWEQMRGRKITKDELDQFISVAVRCNWKMETQQSFRLTLNGFKLNGKQSLNGTAKIINDKIQLDALIAAKHGT